MTHTTTVPMMSQHVRNQLSLMAWAAAALCAWMLFIAASHLRAEQAMAASDTSSSPSPYTSAQ